MLNAIHALLYTHTHHRVDNLFRYLLFNIVLIAMNSYCNVMPFGFRLFSLFHLFYFIFFFFLFFYFVCLILTLYVQIKTEYIHLLTCSFTQLLNWLAVNMVWIKLKQWSKVWTMVIVSIGLQIQRKFINWKHYGQNTH